MKSNGAKSMFKDWGERKGLQFSLHTFRRTFTALFCKGEFEDR